MVELVDVDYFYLLLSFASPVIHDDFVYCGDHFGDIVQRLVFPCVGGVCVCYDAPRQNGQKSGMEGYFTRPTGCRFANMCMANYCASFGLRAYLRYHLWLFVLSPEF